MATFDPRRLLMFAVKVLERHHTNPIVGKHAEGKKNRGAKDETTCGNVRKASVGIRDFLGQEQTVAGHGPHGIEVGFGELSRYSQKGEGCEGHGNLIRFQI